MPIDKKLLAQVKQAAQDIQSRVRIVLPYKGQYLLETLSNPKWPENLGKRRFIGGGVEEGETPEQAAARELFEELGIKVDPSRFKAIGKNPDKQHEHYLQLKRHGLKPGEYKTSVGSDPIIYLNKGLPQGDDYTGADLAKLLNVKTAVEISPALPGKATGPVSPLPKPNKINMPSPGYTQKMQHLNIPKGFENDSNTLYSSNAANYYVPEEGYPAGQARAFNHQNISGNIQNQQAYNANTRNMANAAFANRMGTPWTVAYNPNKGSYAQVRDNTSKVRTVNIGTDNEAAAPWMSMPSWTPGLVATHEAEHGGTQLPVTTPSSNPLARAFGAKSYERDYNPTAETFRAETPAVLAELAAGSQSAYLSNNKQPLTGNMTIDPRLEFKVPLETFRKEVERRGHTGGAQNVSMTELLNSPDGQEFLRMNLQRERIRKMREQGQ